MPLSFRLLLYSTANPLLLLLNVDRLGSGDVSLRYDRWLEEGLLAELILVVHISDIDLRIRDRLLSIPIPSNTNLKDCVAWSSSAASCMRCQAADETVLHCLRDCGATMSIWSKRNIISFGKVYDGDEWLLRNIYSLIDNYSSNLMGVPFLLNLPDATKSHLVTSELYAVSRQGLSRLNELEGTSGITTRGCR
uniref:Gamma-glutamylcyclotransferase family protein n=1 Tax=Populus trichocarpa TaxID=3694 RepID=B9I2R6_POPTR